MTTHTAAHRPPPPQGEDKARADRAKGGLRSARAQQRDSFGQFAGAPRPTAGQEGLSDAPTINATPRRPHR